MTGADLTARERQLLRMLTLPNAQIARELGLATGTVKNTLSGVYRKVLGDHRHTGENRRVATLMRALQLGLVRLDEVRVGDRRVNGGMT